VTISSEGLDTPLLSTAAAGESVESGEVYAVFATCWITALITYIHFSLHQRNAKSILEIHKQN
jgi:hypothetical protein